MGIVRLGVQRSLARPVAVKTLRDPVKSDRNTLKLLREAWVTGRLEHPNVVPIYDVALEPDGSPLIVLKKIEGTGWDELMHDARAVRERFGETDLLEWNLRILLQVCNAVGFAHSRGVLHRDLKPENVMIGEFGEVYVVDSGIAVSLTDDQSGRLPLASQARLMAGTPLYMAPEMLGGPQSRLSKPTDVYLLGAVLYEIVTGGPPHRGDALMELVAQIVESNPPLDDDVPGELARIIRRAMDPDPDGRFESAEQFRLALQGFLQHRSAQSLADKAGQRLSELEARMAQVASNQDSEDHEPIYRAFAESRFGYKHALEVWPESDAARRGLSRAIEVMVEFELRQGEPESARALLGDLHPVPEALAQRVEAARLARREEAARRAALWDDSDPSAGRRTRAFLAIILGTLWSVSPLVSEVSIWFGSAIERTHLFPLGFDAFTLLLMLGLGVWAPESLMRTRLNRILATSVFLAMALQCVMHSVEFLGGGASVEVVFRHSFMLWAGLAAVTAAAVDWRLLLPAAAYAIGFVVLAFWPRATYVALAICNEVLLWTAVALWFRMEDLAVLRERRDQRVARRRAWLRSLGGRSRVSPVD